MDHAQAQPQPQPPVAPEGPLRPVASFGRQFLHSRLNSLPDPSMILSDEERQWTLAIKEALHNSSHFADDFHLSDLAFAQQAIVAQGNVAEALVRIEGLQHFYEEYNIDHTLEQALYYMREFMLQQPGYLLHLDVSPLSQQAWMVTDSAAFRFENALANDDHWKICVCGIYYAHYIMWTTFASIRQGMFSEVECDSVGWHNFNMEFVNRLFGELFSYIPIKFRVTRAYNTTVIANLLFSLARPFMSTSHKRSVQLGCQVMSNNDDTNPGIRRLSEFYLQPSVDVAMRRILKRTEELMQIRKYNEDTFQL